MSAFISSCGRYRYTLRRDWGGLGQVLFVMLNPSTADAEKDDPTIRKCVSLAKGWGMGALAVVNLFAWRATEPTALLDVAEPVGPENDASITTEAQASDRIVLAWGRHQPLATIVQARAFVVKRLLSEACPRIIPGHLGRNGDGSPKHPLYLKATTLMQWDQP